MSTTETASAAADPAGQTTTRLVDLADIGKLTAEISAPDATGTVVYQLRGPRISGALSVAVGRPLHITEPNAFAYSYGIAAGQWAGQWRDRLTVYGVQLVGSHHTITAETLAQSPDRIAVDRLLEDGEVWPEVWPAPVATDRRARAVVAAILADFAARDDLAELWATAARSDARTWMASAAAEVERTDAARTAANAEHRKAAHRLSALDTIASGRLVRGAPAALLGHL
ncbi:hypothetical protein [Nocardia salmonicida]|uniref:hypothetical protein n=1 Tax=Nocardia salmonicida TaxID=53431 RepID=UPI0037B72128